MHDSQLQYEDARALRTSMASTSERGRCQVSEMQTVGGRLGQAFETQTGESYLVTQCATHD